MSTSLLYHGFGIRGYQYVNSRYEGGAITFMIRQNPFDLRCSICGSREISTRVTVALSEIATPSRESIEPFLAGEKRAPKSWFFGSSGQIRDKTDHKEKR